MIKKKISKKQEKSKKTGIPDPIEYFKTVTAEDLIDTLIDCIKYDDMLAFRDVLNAYVKANTIARVAREMGISRRAIYHMISEDSNPTIKTIAKLYQAMKKAA
jgi:probable addiction module antidote protein